MSQEYGGGMGELPIISGASAFELDTGPERDVVIRGTTVHLVFAPEAKVDIKKCVRTILQDAYIRQRRPA